MHILKTPQMPVLAGEVCYEGILEASRQEIQRFMFWTCILNGAGGHTYGANGIWQVNTREHPFGPSPHGRSWGDVPWDVAAHLPGSQHIGLSKGLLMKYPWWRLRTPCGVGGPALEPWGLHSALCRRDSRGSPDHLHSPSVECADGEKPRI